MEKKKSLRASEAVKRRKAAVLRPRFRGTALQVAQGSGKEQRPKSVQRYKPLKTQQTTNM